MNTLINILNGNQYFKLSAESLLKDLLSEERIKNQIDLYELNGIFAISSEVTDQNTTIYRITLKIPYLNFNIYAEDETILPRLKQKTRLDDFINCLCLGLDIEEIDEVNKFIHANYDLKCRLIDTEGILEIPVIVDKELYVTSIFEVTSDLSVWDLNTNLNLDFCYPIDENSGFDILNGLYLPNQYDNGNLCLGKNKQSPNSIENINLNGEFNLFKQGIFNADITEIIVYNKSLFEYILSTIKNFAIKNQFSSNLQKNKVAKLLIKQLKKEEIKSDLNKFFKVGGYYNSNSEDFFRYNYSLYLFLSIFH